MLAIVFIILIQCTIAGRVKRECNYDKGRSYSVNNSIKRYDARETFPSLGVFPERREKDRRTLSRDIKLIETRGALVNQ